MKEDKLCIYCYQRREMSSEPNIFLLFALPLTTPDHALNLWQMLLPSVLYALRYAHNTHHSQKHCRIHPGSFCAPEVSTDRCCRVLVRRPLPHRNFTLQPEERNKADSRVGFEFFGSCQLLGRARHSKTLNVPVLEPILVSRRLPCHHHRPCDVSNDLLHGNV